MKKIIKHFKTISFFLGFALDLFFLPKVTSPFYIWIGPIDVTIVFILILIRQAIRRYLHRRLKSIKKEIGLFQDRSQKIIEKKGLTFNFVEKINSSATYLI